MFKGAGPRLLRGQGAGGEEGGGDRSAGGAGGPISKILIFFGLAGKVS